MVNYKLLTLFLLSFIVLSGTIKSQERTAVAGLGGNLKNVDYPLITFVGVYKNCQREI